MSSRAPARKRGSSNASPLPFSGTTRVAALRELTSLSEHGYLKREGERRGARYLPAPALRGGPTE